MKQRGFTLVEVLLSIVIIGILVGMSVPLYQSFLGRNDLDITTQQVVGALRRAQTYARGMNGDSAWSVEVQSSAVTLYKGTDFAARDTSYDEVITMPGVISASGLSVQFSKLDAAPNATGNITLTTNIGETRTVTLNAQGMVNY